MNIFHADPAPTAVVQAYAQPIFEVLDLAVLRDLTEVEIRFAKTRVATGMPSVRDTIRAPPSFSCILFFPASLQSPVQES